jgi:hypothetical protein
MPLPMEAARQLRIGRMVAADDRFGDMLEGERALVLVTGTDAREQDKIEWRFPLPEKIEWRFQLPFPMEAPSLVEILTRQWTVRCNPTNMCATV